MHLHSEWIQVVVVCTTFPIISPDICLLKKDTYSNLCSEFAVTIVWLEFPKLLLSCMLFCGLHNFHSYPYLKAQPPNSYALLPL